MGSFSDAFSRIQQPTILPKLEVLNSLGLETVF